MRIHGLAVVLAVMLGTVGCTKSGRFVYAVGPTTNSVIGLQERSSGTLTVLSSGFSTDSEPVSVAVHPSGQFAWAANFSGSNITIFDRDNGNGTMKAATDPTSGNPLNPVNVGTNPIAMAMTPNGQVLYVLNQGTTPAPGGVAASISIFLIDNTSGNLTPLTGEPSVSTPAGAVSVPVSMALTANSRFLYVADSAQATIAGFAVNSDASLTPMTGSPFHVATNPAFIVVDPLAKFLYVSNPPTNQIFGFTLDPNTGTPSPVSGSPFVAGTGPAGLAIDSTGVLLLAANQGSNNLSGFSINPGTGALTQVTGSPFTTGTTPTFVTVDSTNSIVYVADTGSNDLAGFALTNGTLKPVSGSPFNIAISPTYLTSF